MLCAQDKGVKDVDPVARVVQETRSTIWHHQFGQVKRFLRVVVALPSHVAMCKGILESLSIPEVRC